MIDFDLLSCLICTSKQREIILLEGNTEEVTCSCRAHSYGHSGKHLLLRVMTAALTVALCPCSVASSPPVPRSHTMPSASPLVVTALRPSAPMVALVTKPPWPLSTCGGQTNLALVMCAAQGRDRSCRMGRVQLQ